jgi:hypothetical protein
MISKALPVLIGDSGPGEPRPSLPAIMLIDLYYNSILELVNKESEWFFPQISQGKFIS